MGIEEKFFEYLIERGVDSSDSPEVDLVIDDFIESNMPDISAGSLKKSDYDPNYIEIGTEIEYEHRPTYDMIKKHLEDTGELPAPVDVYRSIAMDHINEYSEYYDDELGLPAMERNLDAMRSNKNLLNKMSRSDPKEQFSQKDRTNLFSRFINKLDNNCKELVWDLLPPNFRDKYSSNRGINTAPIKSMDIDRIDGTSDSVNPEPPTYRNLGELGDNQDFATDMIHSAVNAQLRRSRKERLLANRAKRGRNTKMECGDILLGVDANIPVPGSRAFNKDCFGG